MRYFVLIIFGLLVNVASAQDVLVHLVARMDGILPLANGNSTVSWGYAYWTQTPIVTIPAPLLIFQEGDSVEIKMTNQSQESHTIHLHGLDVDQVNDGVPQTSFYVAPNTSADYRFSADEPGTYLYHCHVVTTLHLTMGMYGMIIVERADNTLFEGGPEYDHQYAFLSSDLEIATNDDPVAAFPFHEIQPDYFMLNGLSGDLLFDDPEQIIQLENGEKAVLRLGNMAYSKTTYHFPEGSNATASMSDGRALPASMSIDSLEVYPGERYSVIIEPEDNFSGYVTVNYYSMENGEYQAVNYIGINEMTYPTNLVELTSDENVKIFPNPSSDMLTVIGLDIKHIRILDLKGNIIEELYSSSSVEHIDLNSISQGLYFIQINGSAIKKFIKL